jgi:hypothetical protein
MPWPKGRKLTPEEVAGRQVGRAERDLARRRRPRALAGVEVWECTACLCWFAAEHFFGTKTNTSGLTSRCRPCHGAQSMRTRDPERHRRAKLAAIQRQRQNNPDRFWAVELRRSFGLTIEQYRALLASQGGGCAVCGALANPDGRRLAVDHDHTSGEVRGILCTPCNWAIGGMRDSPARLEAAAEYLRNPPAKQRRSA